MTFDQDALVQAGYSIVTPVIVSNTNNFLDIVETDKSDVNNMDTVITVVG